MTTHFLYLLLIAHSGFLIILITGRFVDFLFSEYINLTEELHCEEVGRVERRDEMSILKQI